MVKDFFHIYYQKHLFSIQYLEETVTVKNNLYLLIYCEAFMIWPWGTGLIGES